MRVCCLYPDLMNIYADRGNIAVLSRRAAWRGHDLEVRPVSIGDPVHPGEHDLLYVGGHGPIDGTRAVVGKVGTDLTHGEKVVGFVGTSARHHELGPIALAIVKRNVPVDAQLDAGGLPAAQEVIVDPDVGLHVRRERR